MNYILIIKAIRINTDDSYEYIEDKYNVHNQEEVNKILNTYRNKTYENDGYKYLQRSYRIKER